MWETPELVVVDLEQQENGAVATLSSSCIVIIPSNQVACDHISGC